MAVLAKYDSSVRKFASQSTSTEHCELLRSDEVVNLMSLESHGSIFQNILRFADTYFDEEVMAV